jgi:hypothetical protein
MTRQELETERNELFDDNFNYKSNDIDRIKNFCNFLKEKTGVQVCNIQGGIYEYLPQIYSSVINDLE